VSCIALDAGKVRSSGGDHSLKGSVVLHFRGVSQVGFNTKLLLGASQQVVRIPRLPRVCGIINLCLSKEKPHLPPVSSKRGWEIPNL
jgi:hypothetical protein